jgi:choline transport protein
LLKVPGHVYAEPDAKFSQALNASYALTHACALWSRANGTYRRDVARWNMGKFGAIANAIALVYDLFLVVFLAFPPASSVDAASLNWGPIIFLIVTFIAVVFYFTFGRSQYKDPSKDVVG